LCKVYKDLLVCLVLQEHLVKMAEMVRKALLVQPEVQVLPVRKVLPVQWDLLVLPEAVDQVEVAE
jgi:hypothetical protein